MRQSMGTKNPFAHGPALILPPRLTVENQSTTPAWSTSLFAAVDKLLMIERRMRGSVVQFHVTTYDNEPRVRYLLDEQRVILQPLAIALSTHRTEATDPTLIVHA